MKPIITHDGHCVVLLWCPRQRVLHNTTAVPKAAWLWAFISRLRNQFLALLTAAYGPRCIMEDARQDSAALQPQPLELPQDVLELLLSHSSITDIDRLDLSQVH